MEGARTRAVPAALALILVCTAVWDVGHAHRRTELQSPRQDLLFEPEPGDTNPPLCPACLSTHHGAPPPAGATPLQSFPGSEGVSPPDHVPSASRVHDTVAPRAPPALDIARA